MSENSVKCLFFLQLYKTEKAAYPHRVMTLKTCVSRILSGHVNCSHQVFKNKDRGIYRVSKRGCQICHSSMTGVSVCWNSGSHSGGFPEGAK